MLKFLLLCLPFTGSLPDKPVAVDLNGKVHSPLTAPGKASVVFFITTDCPIANAYAPEIKRIIKAYEPKGIRFFLAHVDRQLSGTAAKKHANDYGYRCTVLLDREHRLVMATGATVTPEAAVYVNGRKMYLGRIDDLYYGLGKRRSVSRTKDLRGALDAVLAGRKPSLPPAPAVGCFIPKL